MEDCTSGPSLWKFLAALHIICSDSEKVDSLTELKVLVAFVYLFLCQFPVLFWWGLVKTWHHYIVVNRLVSNARSQQSTSLVIAARYSVWQRKFTVSAGCWQCWRDDGSRAWKPQDQPPSAAESDWRSLWTQGSTAFDVTLLVFITSV